MVNPSRRSHFPAKANRRSCCQYGNRQRHNGTTGRQNGTTAQPRSTTAQPRSTTAQPRSTTAQPRSTTAPLWGNGERPRSGGGAPIGPSRGIFWKQTRGPLVQRRGSRRSRSPLPRSRLTGHTDPRSTSPRAESEVPSIMDRGPLARSFTPPRRSPPVPSIRAFGPRGDLSCFWLGPACLPGVRGGGARGGP